MGARGGGKTRGVKQSLGRCSCVDVLPSHLPRWANSEVGGAGDQQLMNLQGPLTWGGALSPLSPLQTVPTQGRERGRGQVRYRFEVILKPKSAVGRAGRRGQGGGCRGGPGVKEGLGKQIERALESAWSRLVTGASRGLTLGPGALKMQ